MKKQTVAIFVSECPELKGIAEGLSRAINALGHNSPIAWHPSNMLEGVRPDYAIEVGDRLVNTNLGYPILHYIYNPVGEIPPNWIEANMNRGHLFFFADYETTEKAHRQGIRTSEYLPVGFDSLVPQKSIEIKEVETTGGGKVCVAEKIVFDFDFGHFGNPTPQMVDVLNQVKRAYPDARIAIWGNRPMWQQTDFGDCWVGDIPNTNTMFKEMNLCKFYLGDPTYRRPDYFFLQAMGSNSVALCEFSSDIYEFFEQSRFMYQSGNIASCIGSLGGGMWDDVKLHQRASTGEHGFPLWKRDIEMAPCGHKHNRWVDRVQYLMMLLYTKSLLQNCSQLVKEQSMVEVKAKEDAALIRIGFKGLEIDAVFSCIHSKNIKMEELPTRLRIIARKLERMMIEAGNTIGVPTPESIEDKSEKPT